MKYKAYTLIEILLVVGLIGLITAISLPVINDSQYRSELESAIQTTTRALRTAQVNARAISGNSAWGVYLQGDVIVLFRGSSYAGRDPSYDTEYDFADNLTISGISEVVFSVFQGLPSATGNINFSVVGKTGQININTKGVLTY